MGHELKSYKYTRDKYSVIENRKGKKIVIKSELLFLILFKID